MLFEAENYGIIPQKDVSAEVNALFNMLAAQDGKKELTIKPGNYYINANRLPERRLFITNTIGDEEYKDGETPHGMKVALFGQGINDLTIHAEGAVFILEGRMTNAAFIDCKNLTVNGLEFRTVNPEMHEFTVENVTSFSVDFRLDCESRYKKDNNRFYFTGNDYRTDFFENSRKSWGWFGLCDADDDGHIKRVMHPLACAVKIKELSDGLFRVYYPLTSRFHKGETYCVFNTRRTNAGIFIDSCKNFTMKNVKQRFNYSLAFVAQNTHDITLDGLDFAPENGVLQFKYSRKHPKNLI